MLSLSPSQDLLLRLLRQELWQQPTTASPLQTSPGGGLPSSDVSLCDEVFALAVKQSVEGIIAKPLNDLYIQLGAPQEVLVRSAKQKWGIVQTNQHVNQVLAKVVGILSEAGVDYVVVKGPAVARHYPIAALRKPGDIDLYVGEGAYQTAVDALMPHSNRQIEEEEKHIGIYIDGICIEVHHSVISHRRTRDGRCLQQWAVDALHPDKSRTAVIDGTEVNVPSAQAEATYIFYHAWHHLFHHSGVGLRQMCDLMLTLHADHDQIDAQQLHTLLRESHLLHDWRVVGAMLVGYLGLPKEECPLYREGYERQAERLISIVMQMGNHGAEEYNKMLAQRPTGRIRGRLYSMRSFLRHYGQLHSAMPRSTRKAIATYLRQSLHGRRSE